MELVQLGSECVLWRRHAALLAYLFENAPQVLRGRLSESRRATFILVLVLVLELVLMFVFIFVFVLIFILVLALPFVILALVVALPLLFEKHLVAHSDEACALGSIRPGDLNFICI